MVWNIVASICTLQCFGNKPGFLLQTCCLVFAAGLSIFFAMLITLLSAVPIASVVPHQFSNITIPTSGLKFNASLVNTQIKYICHEYPERVIGTFEAQLMQQFLVNELIHKYKFETSRMPFNVTIASEIKQGTNIVGIKRRNWSIGKRIYCIFSTCRCGQCFYARCQ